MTGPTLHVDDTDGPAPGGPRRKGAQMRIAMVGLGKMGANMTQRLIEHGHEVVAFDLSEPARSAAAAVGATTVASLEDLPAALTPPRVAWVMVPAGAPTNDTITTLGRLFGPGDIVIDGGNSNYKDTAPLVGQLAARGVALLDAGTSGASGACARGTASWSGAPRRPWPWPSPSSSPWPRTGATPTSVRRGPATS